MIPACRGLSVTLQKTQNIIQDKTKPICINIVQV